MAFVTWVLSQPGPLQSAAGVGVAEPPWQMKKRQSWSHELVDHCCADRSLIQVQSEVQLRWNES